MSRNLKTYLQEDVRFTAKDFVTNLVEVVPGRSIGEKFVVKAALVAQNSFVVELDDGDQFKITCEKLS